MKVSPWPLVATLFRIVIVPIIVVLMIYKPLYWGSISCVLFIIASITDWLDGYLARKLNSVTIMGKFLDPLADKVLVSSVLILFIESGLVHYIAVLILINRDMIVGSVRSIAASQGQIIAAGNVGKWKTTIQMIGIPFLFLSVDWDFPILKNLGDLLIWLSVLLSLISGCQYLSGFMKENPVRI